VDRPPSFCVQQAPILLQMKSCLSDIRSLLRRLGTLLSAACTEIQVGRGVSPARVRRSPTSLQVAVPVTLCPPAFCSLGPAPSRSRSSSSDWNRAHTAPVRVPQRPCHAPRPSRLSGSGSRCAGFCSGALNWDACLCPILVVTYMIAERAISQHGLLKGLRLLDARRSA
jgi:hypothetical protein